MSLVREWEIGTLRPNSLKILLTRGPRGARAVVTPVFGCGQSSEAHLGATGDHDPAANGAIITIYAPAYLIPPGPTLSLLSTTTRPTEEIDFIEVNGQLVLTTNPVQRVTGVLAWPASATNYVLQSTQQLSPTNIWRNLPTEPTVAGGFLVLTNSAIDGQRFYRLRRF